MTQPDTVEFFPLDILTGLPAGLLQELRGLFFQEKPLAILRRVMAATGCDLRAACQALTAVEIDTRKRIPISLERHSRVMIATGRSAEAAQFLADFGQLPLEEGDAWVEAIATAVGYRLTSEQAAELLEIRRVDGQLRAEKRMREMVQVGLAEARLFTLILASDPDYDPQFAEPPDGPYAVLVALPEVSPYVEAALQNYFPAGDWSGARRVLALYGQKNYEREVERVQLAVLSQCQGEIERLLKLVEIAKRDYRDVLMGE